MPRIPTLNRMYIAPARDYNAGGTARVISQTMGIAGQIAGTINNIQDTANIQSSLTEAKNNFNNTFNEYKIKYADNPQEFNKQITNYRNNLIQDTVKNSNVSLANKNKFQQILDNNFDNFDNEIFKTTRQLQVNKIDTDITNSITASKNTFYIHGKNGNFELFVNDLSKELADVESIGKTAYSVNTLNSKLNNIKKDNAKNYIEGLILTNPLLAKSQLEEEKFNNLLDQQEINYYLNNIIKQVENNNKDLESQGKSNNTELQAEAVLQLDNRFNDFDISGNIIKNKNLNNIDSIIDYQNFNENLYNQGLISDKTYNTYKKAAFKYGVVKMGTAGAAIGASIGGPIGAGVGAVAGALTGKISKTIAEPMVQTLLMPHQIQANETERTFQGTFQLTPKGEVFINKLNQAEKELISKQAITSTFIENVNEAI